MEEIFFKFHRFFQGFGVCFDTTCYFISEGRLSYPLSGDMIIVCRVNKFILLVDFVRDPNKFQIL